MSATLPIRDPTTPEEWQEAVNGACGLRLVADCMMYGIITGPKIDVARCDEIIELGFPLVIAS